MWRTFSSSSSRATRGPWRTRSATRSGSTSAGGCANPWEGANATESGRNARPPRRARGRPDVGERCAELAEQELRNQIGDSDLTFITVGLGGGTGTGIAPFLAELAQAAGSIVIALATTPFRAERGRMNNARAGIQRLQSCSDSLIVLDNNRLLDLVPHLPVY